MFHSRDNGEGDQRLRLNFKKKLQLGPRRTWTRDIFKTALRLIKDEARHFNFFPFLIPLFKRDVYPLQWLLRVVGDKAKETEPFHRILHRGSRPPSISFARGDISWSSRAEPVKRTSSTSPTRPCGFFSPPSSFHPLPCYLSVSCLFTTRVPFGLL